MPTDPTVVRETLIRVRVQLVELMDTLDELERPRPSQLNMQLDTAASQISQAYITLGFVIRPPDTWALPGKD